MDSLHMQSALAKHLEAVPVIPVLTVHDVSHAVDLAEALVSGGLYVLEVTLRTTAALDVIGAMAQVDGAVVGAGTLLTRDQVARCVSAGAVFGVSPGSTDEVLDACEDAGLALLPGIDNVTTAMQNLTRGYRYQKFFPAEQSGGVSKLKALYHPLPDISFCPTGGVNVKNAPDYLNLPNVTCVGGSWITPAAQIEARQWDVIAKSASDAMALGSSFP